MDLINSGLKNCFYKVIYYNLTHQSLTVITELSQISFSLKNRSYISKEIISLLKQRTQMKVISLHVTIFISNIEEYS